jgi:uncharacterized protein YraI
MRKFLIFSTAAMAIVGAGAAYADSIATAITNVNVRAGPGSQNPVIGVIGAGQSVDVGACTTSGRWCNVAFNGGEGWVYARNLSGDFGGSGMISDEQTSAVPIDRPRTSRGAGAGVVTGGAAGAVTGAIVGGPAGAAVGGVAGAIAGGTAGQMLDPPMRVRTYISSHRVRPIYLQDEVVVGSTLPETVELRPVPDYRYEYVYVNDRPVLVEPSSRRIVYVYD